MAERREIYKATTITADTPTNADGWVNVSSWSHLAVTWTVPSTPTGTTPRLDSYIQFADHNQVTGADSTTARRSLQGTADFFDQAATVTIADIPVGGPYARIYNDVSGTSPSYYLIVSVVAYD